MKNITSLLSALLVGKEFFQVTLMKRIFLTVIGLILLILISGVMICCLTTFSLGMIYNFMLQSGVPVQTVLTTISAIILIFILIFGLVGFICFQKLENLLEKSLNPRSELSKIIDSFKDGFNLRK